MEALQTDQQITPTTTIKRHGAAAGRVRHCRGPLKIAGVEVRSSSRTSTSTRNPRPTPGHPHSTRKNPISDRSPLEWIIDRYHVKTDKASGIINDPNDFLREQGHPDAVVNLIKRLVTVSMRTQELLETLPKLEIPEVQG